MFLCFYYFFWEVLWLNSVGFECAVYKYIGLWLVLMCDTAFYVDHLYINPLSTVHYVQILYVCVFTSALLPVHYTPQRPAAVQPLQVGLASLSN